MAKLSNRSARPAVNDKPEPADRRSVIQATMGPSRVVVAMHQARTIGTGSGKERDGPDFTALPQPPQNFLKFFQLPPNLKELWNNYAKSTY
jgi:hypothetical protein